MPGITSRTDQDQAWMKIEFQRDILRSEVVYPVSLSGVNFSTHIACTPAVSGYNGR